MDKRHVLVIDCGSSGPRCVVLDEETRVVAQVAGEWTYLKEHDAPAMARAFDPEAVWQLICRLTKDAITAAQIDRGQVAAVAVTGQRQSVAFLDERGDEVYLGPNVDLRAVFEGAAIDEEMRDRVYQATGHLPSLLFAAAKLRWFQLHRSEAYDKIAGVVTLADWVVWRLTGTLASEPTLASEAGLLDLLSREWCGSLLQDLGLKAGSVPLVEAATLVGETREEVSVRAGLAPGTPVAIAGADTQCGLLGLGVSTPHQVGIVAGWSAPLQMVTARPILSPDARTWAGCFLQKGWVLESSAGAVGDTYEWLARTLYGDAGSAFEEMDGAAGAAPVGSDGTSAFLGPSRMDMADVGMIGGGLLFPVPITHSGVGKGHLVRASLEAACYAIRANLEQAEELAGIEASDIAVGGGMTRTSTWVRILADVLGREISVSLDWQASAVGAGLCARTALGDFGSLSEASSSIRSGSIRSRFSVVEPDPLSSAEYQDHYARWRVLSDELGALGP